MSSLKEQPCPDCGEMVRQNSLRCWNCGAFMNPELEAKFMELQAKPQEIIFSELPDDEVHTYDEEDDEDDFELSAPAPAPLPQVAVSQSAPELPGTVPIPTAPSKAVVGFSSDVDHSVATGGDALLDIALNEERESRTKRRARKQTGGMKTPGGGIIIFCPYGCKIEVKETHRGMTGRCPKCRSPFIVPIDPPVYKKSAKEGDATTSTDGKSTGSVGGFGDWLLDLHLHTVNPEKLKLKADSLLKEFVPVDFGFSNEKLLVFQLAAKKGGMFGGGAKTGDPRDAVLQHLAAGKSIDELPVANKYLFESADLRQLKVVQPVANRADSMFHGVPIFGEGRIAIQMPMTAAATSSVYVSVGITQFWELKKQLEAHYGIMGLGADSGIPAAHVYTQAKCHYLNTPLKVLENLEFYEADPTAELETVGYRCGACGLTVSEDGRKKESLGGKSPKGIAKAKCPKCSSKMGEHLLKTLKADLVESKMTSNEE